MEPLLVLNQHSDNQDNYENRPTVKVVILNNNDEVLTFGNFLLGGGVELNESLEQAIHREVLEESGAIIEIIKPLGYVVQFRDYLKKKYQVHGFLAKFNSFESNPTTQQEDEIGKKCSWARIDSLIDILEDKILLLENNNELDKASDSYQGPLYNAKTQIVFLKKAKEELTR